MALEFQRPPDWIMQEYANRKGAGEIASEALGTGLNSYVQQKAQERTQSLAQEDRDMKLAQLSSEGGQNAIDTLNSIRKARGLPPLSVAAASQAQAPAQAAPAQDQSMGMTPNEMQAQQSLPDEHPAGSPIISHWNSLSTSGSPAPNAGRPTPPVLGSDPALQEFIQGGAQNYQNKYGSKGMSKVKEALAIEKGLQDTKKNPVMTEQYLALQSGDADALTKAFPGGIPENFIGPSLSATARNVSVIQGPTGGPIRVSKTPGSRAENVDVPGVSNQSNPIQSKLTPNEYKTFQSEVNDFDKDKTVTDNRTMLNQMGNVESMLNNYNPALTGPIASRQARAIAGEVGALTDSDVARQALDPSLIGRIKKAVSVAATGELPQDQLDLLRESIAAIKQGAQARVSSVASERAQRLSQNFGGKISADELMGSMNLPSNFPAPKRGQSQPGQEVTKVINGQSYVKRDGQWFHQ